MRPMNSDISRREIARLRLSPAVRRRRASFCRNWPPEEFSSRSRRPIRWSNSDSADFRLSHCSLLCSSRRAASWFMNLRDFESLNQLAGIELAISETRPFALWMKKKLPLTNVTIVPFNGMVGEFLAKDNFAQQAYVFSEPFVAREQGSDPQALPLSEIGYNPYASVLVTTESTIAAEPALVQDIVAACQAGWVDYLVSHERTNQRLHSENPEMTLAALEFGSQALQDTVPARR